MTARNSDARPEGSRPGVTRSVSCRDTGGALCTPAHRCPAHHIDRDPERLGDLLVRLFGGAG